MTTTLSPDPDELARHVDAVRALARRLVRDGGDAEDAAQEAWLVALRGAPPGDVPLGWWVRGVLRNVVRHVRRDAATRRRHEHGAPSPSGADAPDRIVERTEIHHRVVGLLLALDEPYRETLLLRFFEGLSAAEIARRAGVPAATVRSRVKRGLEALRARLDEGHDGDRRRWAVLLVPPAVRGRTRVGGPALAAGVAAAVVGAAALLILTRPWTGSGAGGLPDVAGEPASGAAPGAGSGDVTGGRRPARRAARPVAATASAPDGTDGAAADSGAAADAAAASPSGVTGIDIEVVDAQGARVAEGTVELEFANVFQLADVDVDRFAEWIDHLVETPLADANPRSIRDLPREMFGLELEAIARVPGAPPTAPVKFTVRAGRVVSVTLRVTGARTARVLVLDRETDLPIADATVVSRTEMERRGRDAAAVRGIQGPGSAVTGADGRCLVQGLGAGEHELVVDAPGHLRQTAKWDGDEAVVRLPPAKAGGRVTAHVSGPGGDPVEGIGVKLLGSDRVVRTDRSGAATFEAVPPGPQSFALEVEDWVAARVPAGRDGNDDVFFAPVDVTPGGDHRIALGIVTGTAVVEVRVVGEDGAPVRGASVSLGGAHSAESVADDAGFARFERVRAGAVSLSVESGRARWWFGSFDVADGDEVRRTCTLGAETFRGRVTHGPDRRPVGRSRVYFGGPAHGSVPTDEDGRFEVLSARQGTYSFEVHADAGGARRGGVEVPGAADVVLELQAYGGVAVRFAAARRADLAEAEITVVVAGGTEGWTLEPGTGDDDLVSPPLLPDRYEVVVTRDGRTRRFPVEVRSGATSVVTADVP